MKKLTVSDCADFFREQNNFCILTHRKPDGDTLGSAATLCRGLRQLGKTAYILCNPEVTAKYAPVVEGLTTDTVAENAVIVCVDTASAGILPAAFADLADKIALRIDHHASATSFTQMELVDGGSAACGEIIYDIRMQLGVTLDKPLANALYTAVSTDTGCFRFANTTAHTLRVAAACAEVSDDLYELNNLYFADLKAASLNCAVDLNAGVPRTMDCHEFVPAWKSCRKKLEAGAVYDVQPDRLRRQIRQDSKRPNRVVVFARRVRGYIQRKLK